MHWQISGNVTFHSLLNSQRKQGLHAYCRREQDVMQQVTICSQKVEVVDFELS